MYAVIFLNILKASRDSAFSAILILLKFHFVADQDADTMHAHLSRQIGQHDFLALLDFYSKECVGQCLNDSAFKDLFCLRDGIHAYEHEKT